MTTASEGPGDYAFDSSRFVDNLLSDEELEVVQFLSDPENSIDDLSDEELSQYIDVVGGVERWMDLQRMAVRITNIAGPATPSDIMDELAPAAELRRGIKNAVERAVRPANVDASDVTIPKVRLDNAGWQKLMHYLTVGLAASAATLLLVANFLQTSPIAESRLGWTARTIDQAIETSQAAADRQAARKNTYEQLAENLSELEDSLFQDVADLHQGLRELYRSCHELRLQLVRFNLEESDKIWLREECDGWANLTLEKLNALDAQGSQNSQNILLSVKQQLNEMRRKLNDPLINASRA